MYMKDKKFDVHLRLNERQYYYLKGTCDAYGIKPAEFLRMIIDSAQAKEKANGVDPLEDITSNKHNIV